MPLRNVEVGLIDIAAEVVTEGAEPVAEAVVKEPETELGVNGFPARSAKYPG
jgi:hypothetical protein